MNPYGDSGNREAEVKTSGGRNLKKKHELVFFLVIFEIRMIEKIMKNLKLQRAVYSEMMLEIKKHLRKYQMLRQIKQGVIFIG